MVERARELIKPYSDRDGVIGIYVVGSAARPYRDALSDYDIEVIVEDAVYERTPDDERQTFAFKEDEPKVVDHEFYLIPWSDFFALTDSTHDLFHYPYQHAVVLHDPAGRITPIIEQLAALPEDVRRERITRPLSRFPLPIGACAQDGKTGRPPVEPGAPLRGRGEIPRQAALPRQGLVAGNRPLE